MALVVSVCPFYCAAGNVGILIPRPQVDPGVTLDR